MAHKLTAQVSGGTVARYAQNVQIEAGGKGVADGFILSSSHPVILVRFSPPNYQTKCEERTTSKGSKWRRWPNLYVQKRLISSTGNCHMFFGND